MAVGKKLRWEIFRRDNFACRYCGRSIHDGAVLEVDHVNPRARRGADVPTNLVTACDACNSGKSDTPISAPPIDDVPQEAFRRACTERGITDPTYTDADGEVTSLAQKIRGNYTDEEWNQFTSAARYWHEDDEPLTDEEAEIRAAHEAFLDEQRDRYRLERIVNRFFELQSPEVMEPHYQAAEDYFRNQPAVPPAQEERVGVWQWQVAASFFKSLEDAHFATLATEERAEWIEYASAWYGHPDPEDPWAAPQDFLEQKAAAFAFRTSRGRSFHGMCSGRGVHIRACPRRAEFRFWARSTCPDCDHPNLAHTEGNLACAVHVEEIRNGELRCETTGLPAELLNAQPLDSSKKEPA